MAKKQKTLDQLLRWAKKNALSIESPDCAFTTIGYYGYGGWHYIAEGETIITALRAAYRERGSK